MRDIKIDSSERRLRKDSNFFTQYLKIIASEVIRHDAENEVKGIIQLLVTILSKISIYFRGLIT